MPNCNEADMEEVKKAHVYCFGELDRAEKFAGRGYSVARSIREGCPRDFTLCEGYEERIAETFNSDTLRKPYPEPASKLTMWAWKTDTFGPELFDECVRLMNEWAVRNIEPHHINEYSRQLDPQGTALRKQAITRINDVIAHPEQIATKDGIRILTRDGYFCAIFASMEYNDANECAIICCFGDLDAGADHLGGSVAEAMLRFAKSIHVDIRVWDFGYLIRMLRPASHTAAMTEPTESINRFVVLGRVGMFPIREGGKCKYYGEFYDSASAIVDDPLFDLRLFGDAYLPDYDSYPNLRVFGSHFAIVCSYYTVFGDYDSTDSNLGNSVDCAMRCYEAEVGLDKQWERHGYDIPREFEKARRRMTS